MFCHFKKAISTSPLAGRGWAFQERALSARDLHLTSELGHWECKEACIGEDMDAELMDSYNVQDGFWHLKEMLLADQGSSEISALTLHDHWAWVIEELSKRSFTITKDKFPALSGVAQMFAAKQALGTYLCGLWENEFHRHLLWFCIRDGPIKTSHRRSVDASAPTWSWASIDGPVRNPAINRATHSSTEGFRLLYELGSEGLLTHKILSIESISCEREGRAALFGSVIKAEIKASGILKPVKRGKRVRDSTFEIERLTGEAVGLGSWDIDQDQCDRERKQLWVCPVMQCKELVQGLCTSECLLLESVARSPLTS
ncbi:hypothetical protein H2199_003986 [Coniosporium tulheliwenetii]|uniref:Uncharacterized protein n=1 Tax=Coniosporium tulheliwenetii TaxID=3383036 RepID=A0ACC2Z9Y6_9PEZI|nr:hypothetical protein H2199_003986 [Cladosporium sp. JES 115]